MEFVTLLALLIFSHSVFASKEIAFTFDDSPTRDSAYMTGEERTEKIIQNLASEQVSGAAFFVNSNKIDEDSSLRLKNYVLAGHVLGNHTHTHKGLKGLQPADFINDIIKTDKILTSYNGYKRWFRYPFLGRGKTKEIRDKIYNFLDQNNYKDAYVTVDNYDWYMNKLFIDAVKEGRKVNFKNLKSAYIEALWDSVKFYDELAIKVLNRSPKHVLLLHENDLAAMFVGDLAKFFKEKGWKIISTDEAYSDSLLKNTPDTLRNGNGKIAAIASSKGFSNEETRDKYQSKEAVEKLFMDMKVFDDIKIK